MCQDLWRHVTRFANQVHHLVVAEKDDELSAGFGGLSFERDQEIHDSALALTAIRVVAGLHERRGAAAPAAFRVDEPCTT